MSLIVLLLLLLLVRGPVSLLVPAPVFGPGLGGVIRGNRCCGGCCR